MSLLEPERFWSESLDRRLDAVRNIRRLDRDVALSGEPPGAALAAALSTHLAGLDPEQDLGTDAFGPWHRFQSEFLGVLAFDGTELEAHAKRLATLDGAAAATALALLRDVADLAEDSAHRLRHGLLRYDPDAW